MKGISTGYKHGAPSWPRALAAFFASLVLAASFAVAAHAAEKAVGGAREGEAASPVSIDSLVAYAVEHNPALRAARLEWLRALQVGPQASAYDDPMLSYTYPLQPVETRLGPQDHILSLSQRLPFPGKLGVKGEIADKGAEIARLKYEKALREVAYEVKKSYYELFYYDKAVRLTKEQIGVFDFYIKAEMADYAVGRKDLNDVVDAQTRYARAANDLAVFEELRRAEQTRFNTLLNLPPEEPLGELKEPEEELKKSGGDLKEPKATKLAWALDDLYSFVLDNEEVKIAEKNVERNTLEEKLARYRYLPDFRLGVNYSAIGDPETGVRDAGRDATSVTFGVTIPLWFGKNRAANEEARLGRERSVLEKTSVTNNIRNRLKKIYADGASSYKLIEIYADSLVPQAKALIETAEIKYKNGEGSIAGIFNAQTLWLNFNLAYYRALSTYLEKAAEMESLIGRHLEKTGAAQ
ncbi:MAG: TolC family protein [Thermodesulfobacteriota bacterium]